MGILVDTCFFIDLERGQAPLLPDALTDEEIFLSAVSVAELYLGLRLARDAHIYTKRKAFIDTVLEHVAVLDFTPETAQLHADYAAALLKNKLSIGSHDLLIAATAGHYHYPLVTRNAKDFSKIPDLVFIEYQRMTSPTKTLENSNAKT